jgi:toxin YoeB
MQLCWTQDAWDDYLYWQKEDKKTLKRINTLIKEVMRSPFEGIGKPEPLRGNLSGLWSRRIDSANRLIYQVTDNAIIILSAKSHYDKTNY